MVVVSHLFPFYGKILPNYSHFNPRLREGGDLQQQQQELIFTISIHASEKEATDVRKSITLTAQYFNPRLREGGDGNIL